MKCNKCKYYAVPLTAEEKKLAHCPGADPMGDESKKICVLKNKDGFDVNPEDCKFYFPSAMRWR